MRRGVRSGGAPAPGGAGYAAATAPLAPRRSSESVAAFEEAAPVMCVCPAHVGAGSSGGNGPPGRLNAQSEWIRCCSCVVCTCVCLWGGGGADEPLRAQAHGRQRARRD